MPRVAIAVVGAGVVGGLALAGCGGAKGISLPCAPQPQGQVCIRLFADGRTVKDVAGYLSASASPLAGKTWRLALSSYPCEPGPHARPACSATATYAGRTRHGNPPRATSCRESGTTTMVTTPSSGCDDTLAEDLASFGDFSGFQPPKSFPSKAWLCVSEQLRSGGSWREASTPPRACATVA